MTFLPHCTTCSCTAPPPTAATSSVGWSPSRDHTEREKALTMLWRRWAAAAPPGLLDPAKHPELSDEAIAELARQRDEIRARTLADLDETEAS